MNSTPADFSCRRRAVHAAPAALLRSSLCRSSLCRVRRTSGSRTEAIDISALKVSLPTAAALLFTN